MAGTELFGSPLGDRAFAEDTHTQNLARLEGAQADKAQLAVQQERQFATLMKLASTGDSSGLQPGQAPGDQDQPGFSSSNGISSKLMNLANLATQAGLVDRGSKLAAQAALLNSREAAANASKALTGIRQTRQRRDDAELVGRVLEDVTDQDSFDRALATYQMTTGKMSKYAGLPYTPELVQRLRDQAMSVKDQEAQRIREDNAASLQDFREERLRQHDEANAISAAARGVQRNREGRLEKVGGGKLMTISPNERSAATALLTKDFPEFAEPGKTAEAATAANTIASSAKALMQKNPALDWAEALAQAYTAERPNFRRESSLLGKDKVKFEDGTSPQTARMIPGSMKELKVGRYYYNDKGRVGKWDGKRFVDPNASRSAAPATNEDEDAEASPDNEDEE